MKYLLPIIVGILCSCGGTTGKTLFNSWTAVSNGAVLDISQASYGSNTMAIVLQDGTVCSLDLTIWGTNSSGTYEIENDTCSTFDGDGSYTNNGVNLTLTDSNGSSVWY